MVKFNLGGQSTPNRKPDAGYYRAPEKAKPPVFNFKAPSKTPNMDALRASKGPVTQQSNDMAKHLDAVRKNKSFGGKGWGGP